MGLNYLLFPVILLCSGCLLRTTGQEMFENAKISKIAGPFQLAEGPHWDSINKVLLFVDILGKSVHRYDPGKNVTKELKFNESVSLIIPVKGNENQYVISLGKKLALLNWDGGNDHTLKIITTVSSKEEIESGVTNEKTRINDGKADHLGNVWFGTMDKDGVEGKGSFYRLSSNGKLDTIADNISISNGIGWNLDKTLMYYIDSLTRRVDVFDYDSKTGITSNRRPFFNLAEKNLTGIPDGMTMDSDDNLWIACWDGSSLVKVSGKTGDLLGVLTFPALRITSAIFGGEDLDVLFVTSASFGLSKKQIQEQPLSGCVFAVHGISTKGVLSNPASIPPL